MATTDTDGVRYIKARATKDGRAESQLVEIHKLYERGDQPGTREAMNGLDNLIWGYIDGRGAYMPADVHEASRWAAAREEERRSIRRYETLTWGDVTALSVDDIGMALPKATADSPVEYALSMAAARLASGVGSPAANIVMRGREGEVIMRAIALHYPIRDHRYNFKLMTKGQMEERRAAREQE